jgi:hypothetical protein
MQYPETEMDEIKSARQIAEEKVEQLGEATAEERLQWKYAPEGERLAARYIKEGSNLVAELSQYEDSARKYVTAGVAQVLISNITLPSNDLAKKNNKQAMNGLKLVKMDQVSLENVYSKMRRIFDHYLGQGEQQRKQAYQSLKAEFEAQVKQALQQQLGSFAGMKIDVENQPQFQTEWRRRQTQLDSQYLLLLDEYKQELRAVP